MPSGTDLAQYYIQIIPSADGIGGNIVSAIEKDKTGEKAGDSVGKGMAAKIKSLAIWTAVGKVIGDSIRAGAKLEQSIGGIEQIFGIDSTATNKLMEYSKKAFATAGVSANDYMSQVTMFSARLLQGLKGDTDAAVDYSNKAIIQMSDNANTFGTDLSSIQNAYQGFAKANWTMLDNLRLGYGGTASEMARLVNDSGVMGKNFTATAKNISEVSFDKIIDAIQVIQDRMNITGKTSLEAATTISGSLQSLKASYENFMAYLTTGGDVAGALTNLAQSFINFAGNIGKAVMTIIQAIPEVIGNMISTYAPLVIEKGIELIQNFASGMIEGLPNVISFAIDMIGDFVQLVIDNFPAIFNTAIDLINSFVKGMVNAMPMIDEFIRNLVRTIWDFIKNTDWLGLGNTILQTIGYGIKNLGGWILNIVIGIAKDLWNGFLKKVGEWSDVGKNIINGIMQGIKNMASNLVNSAINAAKSALDGVKRFLGIKSPSKAFEEIGKYIDLGLAEGIADNTAPIGNALSDVQDMFGINVGAKPYISAVSGDLGASASNFNYGGVSINVYAKDGQSAQEIAEAVADILQSQININKAVYQ